MEKELNELLLGGGITGVGARNQVRDRGTGVGELAGGRWRTERSSKEENGKREEEKEKRSGNATRSEHRDPPVRSANRFAHSAECIGRRHKTEVKKVEVGD